MIAKEILFSTITRCWKCKSSRLSHLVSKRKYMDKVIENLNKYFSELNPIETKIQAIKFLQEAGILDKNNKIKSTIVNR